MPIQWPMSLPLLAVVEDNEDNRLLLEAILEDCYDVTFYEDGPTGLAGLTGGSLPEVLLLDISLPGMDGVEVLKALRAAESTASLPVIALTAHAMAGDEQRFLDEGFDAYVSKPIVEESLLFDAIERLRGTDP
jgi:two-component system cell cycle response regulator DivK